MMNYIRYWSINMELNEAREILKENGYILTERDLSGSLFYDYMFDLLGRKPKSQVKKEKEDRKTQITARYLAANELFKELWTELKEHFGNKVYKSPGSYVWKKGSYLQEAPSIRFRKKVNKEYTQDVYVSLTMLPGNFYIDYLDDNDNWLRINNVDPNEILQIIIDYYEDPETIKRFKTKPSKLQYH